jgi:hypothetical protein
MSEEISILPRNGPKLPPTTRGDIGKPQGQYAGAIFLGCTTRVSQTFGNFADHPAVIMSWYVTSFG